MYVLNEQILVKLTCHILKAGVLEMKNAITKDRNSIDLLSGRPETIKREN